MGCEAPADIRFCLWCSEQLVIDINDGRTTRKRFCNMNHAGYFWRKYTDIGRAYRRAQDRKRWQSNPRRRLQVIDTAREWREAQKAAGLCSRCGRNSVADFDSRRVCGPCFEDLSIQKQLRK